MRDATEKSGSGRELHAHARPTHSTPFLNRPEAAAPRPTALTAASAAINRPHHRGPERLPALDAHPGAPGQEGRTWTQPGKNSSSPNLGRPRPCPMATKPRMPLPCGEAPTPSPGGGGNRIRLKAGSPKSLSLAWTLPACAWGTAESTVLKPHPLAADKSPPVPPPGPSHRRLGALVGESPLFTRPQSQPPCPPAPCRVQLRRDNRRKRTARPAGGGSAGIPSSGCPQTDVFQINFSPVQQTQATSGTPTQGPPRNRSLLWTGSHRDTDTYEPVRKHCLKW